MWRWVAIFIIGVSLYMPAVQAQSDRQAREEWVVAQRRDYDRDDERRRDRRSEQRENRRQEQERPRREMLSPDERQELNRDLQRANREIYRRGRER
jgi:Ni/Co efflux regulator RcnB